MSQKMGHTLGEIQERVRERSRLLEDAEGRVYSHVVIEPKPIDTTSATSSALQAARYELATLRDAILPLHDENARLKVENSDLRRENDRLKRKAQR